VRAYAGRSIANWRAHGRLSVGPRTGVRTEGFLLDRELAGVTGLQGRVLLQFVTQL